MEISGVAAYAWACNQQQGTTYTITVNTHSVGSGAIEAVAFPGAWATQRTCSDTDGAGDYNSWQCWGTSPACSGMAYTGSCNGGCSSGTLTDCTSYGG